MDYIFSFEKYCISEGVDLDYDSVLKPFDGWIVYPDSKRQGYGELGKYLVKLEWCIIEYNPI